MEKFNKEELISSLIMAGYNKVDILLYTLAINKIKNDKKLNSELIFEDAYVPSATFSSFIHYDEGTYSLGSNSLNDNVSIDNNASLLLGDIMPINKKLVSYFINEDLTDIIIKKAKLIGLDNLSTHVDLFSNKEINIIKEKYGNEIFGELYSYTEKLDHEDYKNMQELEIIDLMSNYNSSNYIYNFCLNEEQQEIARNVLMINAVIKEDTENFKNYEDILEYYQKRDGNKSVLLSVCEAHSRIKKP